MSKVLFTIQLHSIVDVITNSSSELFVFGGDEKNTVVSIISELYPDYTREYDELKDVKHFSIAELDDFLYWHLGRSSYSWSSRAIYDNPNEYVLLSGFTFDELYDTSVQLSNGDEYELRNNIPIDQRTHKYDRSFVTEENKDRVINGIITDVGRFFLYSIDENPNYEFQGKLETIAKRYHLG